MIPTMPHRAAVGWYLGVIIPLIASLLADPVGWAATLHGPVAYLVGGGLVAMQTWAVWSLYHADPDPAVVGAIITQSLALYSEVGR